jgi:hypothetical protein
MQRVSLEIRPRLPSGKEIKKKPHDRAEGFQLLIMQDALR